VEDVLEQSLSHTATLDSTYTARQVIVLRLAIAIVSTSLICHVDRRNAGKTRAEVSVDGQRWSIAREMQYQEKSLMTKNAG
jgi:hypothetical protein